MDLHQHQVAVLSALGAALLSAQYVEKQLALLLKAQGGPGLPETVDALQAQPASERRKTLGILLGELKQRSKLVPELAADLDVFLKYRNNLAHNFASLGSWDLNTPEGCLVAQAFLSGVVHRASQMSFVFGNALDALEYHFKIVRPMPESAALFEAMRRSYGPMLSAWWAIAGSSTNLTRLKHRRRRVRLVGHTTPSRRANGQ